MVYKNYMKNLYEYLTEKYNAHFSGWDFSYIKKAHGRRGNSLEL